MGEDLCGYKAVRQLSEFISRVINVEHCGQRVNGAFKILLCVTQMLPQMYECVWINLRIHRGSRALVLRDGDRLPDALARFLLPGGETAFSASPFSRSALARSKGLHPGKASW